MIYTNIYEKCQKCAEKKKRKTIYDLRQNI